MNTAASTQADAAVSPIAPSRTSIGGGAGIRPTTLGSISHFVGGWPIMRAMALRHDAAISRNPRREPDPKAARPGRP